MWESNLRVRLQWVVSPPSGEVCGRGIFGHVLVTGKDIPRLSNCRFKSFVAYLIKAGYTGAEDVHKLLRKPDRWNSIAIHYVPMIIAFTSQLGSMDDGRCYER